MADDVIREAPSRPLTLTDLRKVSWGAIWAGVMVTIGMEALFISFGIFILAAFSGSVIWSMVWYLVTMAVSFYVGAWTAARLSDAYVRETCILHGLATWGLATLSTILIGGFVAWSVLQLGTVLLVSRAGPVVVYPGVPWRSIEQWDGLIWGGVLLSWITAYFGGANGLSSPWQNVTPEAPAGPRLAA